MRSVKIDRAIYLVDDAARTYRYARPNPFWKQLNAAESERNKRSIHGYTRIFRDGTSKKFFYQR